MARPQTLAEACDAAEHLIIESVASAVSMQEVSHRAVDLKSFVDEVFHPMLNTEMSGQVAGEMAGIMSDIGAILADFIKLSERFQSVHAGLSEMKLK